ncbi:MAG: hypothetical protein IJF33_02035 [Clostridia bacterium]|nr:hypothetical protein [Clostridia bacterium]
MYCIKCGVELSDGQEICPVCNTRVYHPDLPVSARPTYPKKEFASEAFNRRGVLLAITVLCVIPLLLPIVFDLIWHATVTWSGYVAGGVLLGYLAVLLPLWFKHPNPAIFVPCDFAALILYLLYIDLHTNGGWFLGFAFPVTAALGIITTVSAILNYYCKGARLYILGGGVIGIGIWTILIEFLIWTTFGVQSTVWWSLCSFLSLFLLGMLLIVIAIVKPLKESLYKIFFIG